jgi:NAD(P)H-hydrate epimerase
LADEPVLRDNWVLTPHPGEAANLLEEAVDEIQENRFSSVKRIQKKYGGVCVLKGAGSLVIDSNAKLGISSYGNPGMASGGMGDVLTGVIAGLIAQGLSQDIAAGLAVCLHSNAADHAARKGGERGLLAMDLMPYVRSLVNA